MEGRSSIKEEWAGPHEQDHYFAMRCSGTRRPEKKSDLSQHENAANVKKLGTRVLCRICAEKHVLVVDCRDFLMVVSRAKPIADTSIFGKFKEACQKAKKLDRSAL